MKTPTLTLQQARNLHLAAQGLLHAPARPATPAGLLSCIKRMQLLQIDTISVVARSPYLVLYARLGHYPMQWLDDALAKGRIFETWAHEASFAATTELALHRSYNQATRRHWSIGLGAQLTAQQQADRRNLLAHIETAGPVKSSDFERQANDPNQQSGWWGWKNEKRWLESLFARGELMVARRDKFQRVYDLAHRVHPALADMPLPEIMHVQRSFALSAVRTLGITQARWVNDYFRTKPRLKDADLQPWVDEGELLQVAVEGWAAVAYVHKSHRALLRQALRGELLADHTALLSPFDPVVWDRERASSLFDFDYRIECYTPAHKRVYGYFVLPILHGGELVGRLDAKAHRAEGIFEVKAVHWQHDKKPSASALASIRAALAQCAAWHSTPQLKLPSRGI